MPDRERGLYKKYKVERTDGKRLGDCFVLEPSRDPHARVALAAYMQSVKNDGYKELASDLYVMLRVSEVPNDADHPIDEAAQLQEQEARDG